MVKTPKKIDVLFRLIEFISREKGVVVNLETIGGGRCLKLKIGDFHEVSTMHEFENNTDIEYHLGRLGDKLFEWCQSNHILTDQEIRKLVFRDHRENE